MTRSKSENAIWKQCNEVLLQEARANIETMRLMYKCRAAMLDAILEQAPQQTDDLTALLTLIDQTNRFHSTHTQWFLQDLQQVKKELNDMVSVVGIDYSKRTQDKRDSLYRNWVKFWSVTKELSQKIRRSRGRKHGGNVLDGTLSS